MLANKGAKGNKACLLAAMLGIPETDKMPSPSFPKAFSISEERFLCWIKSEYLSTTMEVEMEEDRSLFVVVVVAMVVVRFIAKRGWEKGGRESESGWV